MIYKLTRQDLIEELKKGNTVILDGKKLENEEDIPSEDELEKLALRNVVSIKDRSSEDPKTVKINFNPSISASYSACPPNTEKEPDKKADSMLLIVVAMVIAICFVMLISVAVGIYITNSRKEKPEFAAVSVPVVGYPSPSPAPSPQIPSFQQDTKIIACTDNTIYIKFNVPPSLQGTKYKAVLTVTNPTGYTYSYKIVKEEVNSDYVSYTIKGWNFKNRTVIAHCLFYS